MPSLLAAAEPPPFDILYPDAASPFLLTCDHAANRIPRALGTLGLPPSELDRHIAWDIGAAAVTRGLAARLNCTAVLQNYSRLVIDCNRPPGVPSSIPVRSENTDIPGNIDISPDQAEARRAEIFAPYHAAIATLLDARAAAGRATVLITMHSFTPVYDGVVRPMHAAMLYNRDARLAHALLAELRNDPARIIADNEPYHVSDETDYAVPVHGEKRGLAHVEIEIRQDLITTPGGQQDWVDRLAEALPAAGKKILLF